MTGPECANQAGVARKTVNNMINARTDPTVESIQSVARVFNLECWQLLMPNTGSFKQWKAATELLRMFLTADERGQRLTLEIAQVSIRQSAGD